MTGSIEMPDRTRISQPLTTFLINRHQGTSRVLVPNNSLSKEFPLASGVKQGDPLAPLLFNITLQPSLDALDKLGVQTNPKVMTNFNPSASLGVSQSLSKVLPFNSCQLQELANKQRYTW